MDRLDAMRLFVAVCDAGSLSAAARKLKVPLPTVSRKLALLEEHLGVRLVVRTTRKFVLTDAGRTYVAHCRAMLTEAEAAEESIALSHAEPRGLVRLSCPVALLATRVGPMLADFLQAHPRVSLQVDETNRRVDVVAEGLDLALRVRPPPLADSELILRVLADRGQCLLASPALLARQGMPQGPADLAQWPSLALGQPQDEHRWHLLGPEGAQAQVRHHPRYVTLGMLALKAAALAGVGVVQLPRMFVQAEFARGELVNVLPGWEPRRELIHAVYASRRGQLPAVRALLDHLAAEFAALHED